MRRIHGPAISQTPAKRIPEQMSCSASCQSGQWARCCEGRYAHRSDTKLSIELQDPLAEFRQHTRASPPDARSHSGDRLNLWRRDCPPARRAAGCGRNLTRCLLPIAPCKLLGVPGTAKSWVSEHLAAGRMEGSLSRVQEVERRLIQ